MAEYKKHFGRMRNTGQRCLVILMQLPDRPDHALVVSTDSLPTRFESSLMDIAESAEGQNTHRLYDVLNRRLDPATGKNMLLLLHEAGLLSAVHVDNVIMQPTPNMPFPLRKVLEGMVQYGTAKPVPTTRPEQSSIREVVGEPQRVEETYKVNQFTENRHADVSANRAAIARNLVEEAKMLQQEANRKLEQAYQHDPSIRPADHRPTSIGMASADAMQSMMQGYNNPAPAEPVVAESAVKTAKKPRVRKKAPAA